MLVGVSIIIPLFLLLFYPQDLDYAPYFIFTGLFGFLLGFLMYLLTKKQKNNVSLTLQEGGIIVVFSWIIAIILSAIPFVWGLNMNWTHAIFEVVSGWTTTGLSVIDVTTTPSIYLFWRSFMQFLGGAGLAVIALSSILPMQGLGLYQAEGRNDQLLPHVRRSTKMIMQIYTGYTVTGTLLYYIFGMSFFDAINHSMAAISTGGFSTVPKSIGQWDSISIEVLQ